jgi:hypothetical protein
MAYTDIDKPDDYFNTVLYTGTGASNSVTGVGFQSDLLWFKNRSSALNHILFDSVRGIDKYFYVNLTEAEGTSATILTAVGSDGFTVGANDNVNENTKGIVSWNWLAGGAGVSNTAGDITSTVSANTTSGFSIVSYTGNGTSSATVGHGLGVAPKMTIIKQRNSSNGWNVWTFANNAGDPDSFGELNSTAAWYQDQGGDGPYTTQPTSSLLTLTAYGQVNGNTNTYIAYCFAEKKGFSKFGSYTGNGNADGTFVYTGFKPAFVMLKRTNDTAHWQMQDSKRIGFNPENERLYASDSAAEQTINFIDLLSNGFKCITTDAGANGSGDNFIYMAFAENPFVTSTSIPTTAR